MNFAKIDEKCRYIEYYNFSLTNAQLTKLIFILRNLINCLSKNENNDFNKDYKVLANLCYRLIAGDHATVSVIRANYEKLLISKKVDYDLINIYNNVLSCITESQTKRIPISSINIRNGNFDSLKSVEVQAKESSGIKKPVLAITHSKGLKRTLNLKLNPANND